MSLLSVSRSRAQPRGGPSYAPHYLRMRAAVGGAGTLFRLSLLLAECVE